MTRPYRPPEPKFSAIHLSALATPGDHFFVDVSTTRSFALSSTLHLIILMSILVAVFCCPSIFASRETIISLDTVPDNYSVVIRLNVTGYLAEHRGISLTGYFLRANSTFSNSLEFYLNYTTRSGQDGRVLDGLPGSGALFA
jgi:hypothetical protein